MQRKNRVEADNKSVVLYFHQECILLNEVAELENSFEAQQIFFLASDIISTMRC